MAAQSESTDARRVKWCRRCGTRHPDAFDACPGESLATGPERHGWRITVDTGRDIETFGVLTAETEDGWRARVLTYPSILWMIPGGGASIKFRADSPRAVSGLAIDFVMQHIKRREFRIVEEGKESQDPAVPPVESEPVDLEQTDAAANSEQVQAAQRVLVALPVRFGRDRPEHAGATADVSETGLFIDTDRLFPVGSRLMLRLDIKGFVIPLAGTVVWLREEPETGQEGGRPRGIGIELTEPPELFTRFVRKLRGETEPAVDES